MFRTWNQTITTFLRAAPILALALIAVAPASPAAAQGHCTQWANTLLDTSDNCVNEPWRERAMEVEPFTWKGHEYVILNEGNEFSIFNIDNPLIPIKVATSKFKFGNRGDSDYDLTQFDVCDECRYGVFAHKVRRTVVFDLGTGAEPTLSVGAYETFQVPADLSLGGYVFQKGGQQYLIAADLPGGCVGSSGLYTLDGVGNAGLIECMEIGGSSLFVRGLQTLNTVDGITYLYAAASNGPVHVFRADGAGAFLELVHMDSPPGMFGRRYELSIDDDNMRAASANLNDGVVSTWSLADPAHPALEHTIPATATIVSLRSPSANSASTLFMAMIGWPRSTRTFVVDDGEPEEFEADYWSDDTLDGHNDLPSCGIEIGGTLSSDGSVLFLSRNAVHQVFDLSDCLQPTPAVADLVISPDPVFPGDTVTIRDTTTGRVDRFAVWVTEEPGGILVAGNATPSPTNLHEITYQIPQDLPWDRSYTAHIVVESDDLPPARGAFDTPININHVPGATISVEPSAVVVGETVTLTATAEGNPDVSAYAWIITSPSSSTTPRSGASILVPLDEAGAWTFSLTVDYLHGAATGGTYQATDEITDFDVTSVAADFTISPSSPLHTQVITLDGSISKPVGGNLSYEWRVESVPDPYTGCPAAAVCTIPEASLNPDTTYNVTLKVTNNNDSAISELTKPLAVGNGNVQPTISFRPTNPDIGENILFTINGVPADIDKASWSMGATGCDGADPTPECFPSLWNDCKSQAFKYASQGTRTVSLSVEVAGNVFTAPPVTVTTSSTGSCSGTIPPPTTCSYNLSPQSATFGPKGDESAFSVSTTAGCSWTAQSSIAYPWITVTSPKDGYTGSGTVRYEVSANTGPKRVGIINAAGKGFIVTQEAPWAAANFTMSNPNPEIGEVVTFSVDPVLEVASWDFGEADCRGKSPVINCTFLPSGACNTMQWVYPSSGPKTIKMVLTDGRDQIKIPTVQPRGECCFADGRPDASFTMSADEIYTGETVVFTDTSSKSAAKGAEAVGITWNPTVPEIGEKVTFEIVGVSGDVRAEWDFGGPGCDGVDQIQICNPLFTNCHAFSHTYSSSGGKTVNLTVTAGGNVVGTATNSLTVADVGTCDDGGGGCSYTLSEYLASFPPEGGSGSFNVNTTAECTWNATTTSSWLTIDSSDGTGPGSVAYTVDANGGLSSRAATIKAAGKIFRVNQTADQGDTAPSSWRWTVTRVEDEEGEPVDVDVFTSTEPNTSYDFEEPGRYRITLIATNCFGFDSTVDYVDVTDAPVEDFVVGAAVSLDGANDTHWESDFRFFNPCGEDLAVRIEYQPENTNNTGADLVFRNFGLGPNETLVFGDITEAIPGLEGDEITGSVRIESQSDSGCKVLSISRTFNDTPDGSLGLFVPALPVQRVGREFLDLTGLIQSEDYRTNLRLVNYGDEEVWVPITAYDKGGHQVGQIRGATVRGHSTKQVNAIADWLGLESSPAPFSVRVGVDGYDVQVFATVVDNLTGDSVLYLSSFHDENMIWLVGVASLAGANDSQWRTDLWLYNPTEDWLAGEVEFVVGDNPSDSWGFVWPTLSAHRTKQYLDIVSDELGLDEIRGYIVLTGADGGPAPQVAARTYNLDASTSGTYGLNLQAFASDDLLLPGETGYITGVSNSEDKSVGFRTNIGLLNTDRYGWTGLRVTLYDIYGVEAAEPFESQIAPGKLWQFDIFKKLGLRDVTMTGSIKVEVTSGGGVAAYATEIDNRTQDSIFIPALRKFQGVVPQ